MRTVPDIRAHNKVKPSSAKCWRRTVKPSPAWRRSRRARVRPSSRRRSLPSSAIFKEALLTIFGHHPGGAPHRHSDFVSKRVSLPRRRRLPSTSGVQRYKCVEFQGLPPVDWNFAHAFTYFGTPTALFFSASTGTVVSQQASVSLNH